MISLRLTRAPSKATVEVPEVDALPNVAVSEDWKFESRPAEPPEFQLLPNVSEPDPVSVPHAPLPLVIQVLRPL